MRFGVSAIALLASSMVFGQTPAFDVVSVKHTQNGPIVIRSGETVAFHMQPMRRSGNRVTGNQTLHSILSFAFGVEHSWQIAGPDWLMSDFYEIDAIMPPETSAADMRLMMQSMLADRFALKFHREQREFSAYALVVGKAGARLQEIPPPEHHSYGFGPGDSPGTMRYEATPGMRISSLATSLTRPAGRPVLDETGLKGWYKVRLDWSYESGDRDAGMLSALPQLGLKLEPKKATFDVVVVDQVNREPTAN